MLARPKTTTSHHRLSHWSVFIGFVGLLLFSNAKINSLYSLPFPHFDKLLLKRAGLQDILVILAGFRSVAADIAWVELLQEVSGGGSVLDEDPTRNVGSLKDDTLRVVRIDPSFYRAYLFGSATLAWIRTIDRPQEALEVLKEGLTYNPHYWLFGNYALAIIYHQKKDLVGVIRLLENAVRQPDCPGLTKAILANTYKENGEYQKAIEIWTDVLNDPDNSNYHARARNQIRELSRLLSDSRARASRGN